MKAYIFMILIASMMLNSMIVNSQTLCVGPNDIELANSTFILESHPDAINKTTLRVPSSALKDLACEGNTATSKVEINEPGTYTIHGRFSAEDTASDSVCFSINDNPFDVWVLPTGGTLKWSMRQSVVLGQGINTINIMSREPSVQFDTFIVSNDETLIPSGLANNICSEPTQTIEPSTDAVVSEAEDGVLSSDFIVLSVADSSENRSIIASGPKNMDGSSATTAAFTFTVNKTGLYNIWGRILAYSTSADSFYIKIDDENLTLWALPLSPTIWQWDQAKANVFLTEGTVHRLIIKEREPGTQLDQIYISSKNDTPSGIMTDTNSGSIPRDSGSDTPPTTDYPGSTVNPIVSMITAGYCFDYRIDKTTYANGHVSYSSHYKNNFHSLNMKAIYMPDGAYGNTYDSDEDLYVPRLIIGTEGADFIYGSYVDDFICGMGGDDLELNGRRGQDHINGNIGNDKIRGGRGQDVLRGGKNNDTIYGDLGADKLYGDIGDDILIGGTDQSIDITDYCEGGEGDDTFTECESIVQ